MVAAAGTERKIENHNRWRERESEGGRDNANAQKEEGRSMAPNSIFRHRHLDRRRGWRCTSGIPERRRESPRMNARGGGERGVGVAKSRSPVPPSECTCKSKSKCLTMHAVLKRALSFQLSNAGSGFLAVLTACLVCCYN